MVCTERKMVFMSKRTLAAVSLFEKHDCRQSIASHRHKDESARSSLHHFHSLPPRPTLFTLTMKRLLVLHAISSMFRSINRASLKRINRTLVRVLM
jgi:hypothetical protein